MPLLLGIDTGGTFTDAVLLDPSRGLLAKAKALTTHHELSIGIGEAMVGVLGGRSGSDISLVSLSTTLATNAMVEGQGGRVGLVFIGFDASDATRPELLAALNGDPLIAIDGGHDSFGDERAPLDEAKLVAEALRLAPTITGFAVTARFSTRNLAHENRARALLREITGLPVTCGIDLSAKLDGPRRALTAVLNARLIHLVERLIAATERLMADHGIKAPLMVVRGDGALVVAPVARKKPIETIFSGPAASAVGGAYLSGVADAVISDIGGTTTDVVVLRGGRPTIDPDGAVIGGFRTMVEAIAIRTTGLGGDSEVALKLDGLETTLLLGPRRVMPVSLLATIAPELVRATLERQERSDLPSELDGRFAVPLNAPPFPLAGPEAGLLQRLAGKPAALDKLVENRREIAALHRLAARRIVLLCGLTPSDAAHVLGLHTAWDPAAAKGAARLFSRRRDGRGRVYLADAEAVSRAIVDALMRRSAAFILETALAEDGFASEGLATHPVIEAALDRRSGLVRHEIALTLPLVGLGASAATWYPAIAARLGAASLVPEHAEVANAVGAVVGGIHVEVKATLLQPMPGQWRAVIGNITRSFPELEAALAFAEGEARDQVAAMAIEAGAGECEIALLQERRHAEVEGQDIIVEAIVTARASGRPKLA